MPDWGRICQQRLHEGAPSHLLTSSTMSLSDGRRLPAAVSSYHTLNCAPMVPPSPWNAAVPFEGSIGLKSTVMAICVLPLSGVVCLQIYYTGTTEVQSRGIRDEFPPRFTVG